MVFCGIQEMGVLLNGLVVPVLEFFVYNVGILVMMDLVRFLRNLDKMIQMVIISLQTYLKMEP
jgi:hypothetical protein